MSTISKSADTNNSGTLTVKCPHCKTVVKWSSANRYRPFCSERCRLIDLGDWASEIHKIPGDPVVTDIFSEDQSK